MSVKGSAQLMINGYTFTRHIVKDDTIYWRCTQFRALRCPARHRQRRSTGEVEVVWPHHNHDILERRKREPEVTYITSRKGTLQLEIDRYRFTRQKICKSTIRWECLQTKALCCKARATTNNAVRGAVYYFNNEHNHPPQMERRKAGALRKLKQQQAEQMLNNVL
ncbi:hypothetical protein quinque_012326 [Culex quinquefasciatus]